MHRYSQAPRLAGSNLRIKSPQLWRNYLIQSGEGHAARCRYMPLHAVWSAPVAPSSLNHCTAVPRTAGLYRGVRANTQTCLVRLPFLVPGCNEVRVVGSTDDTGRRGSPSGALRRAAVRCSRCRTPLATADSTGLTAVIVVAPRPLNLQVTSRTLFSSGTPKTASRVKSGPPLRRGMSSPVGRCGGGCRGRTSCAFRRSLAPFPSRRPRWRR